MTRNEKQWRTILNMFFSLRKRVEQQVGHSEYTDYLDKEFSALVAKLRDQLNAQVGADIFWDVYPYDNET